MVQFHCEGRNTVLLYVKYRKKEMFWNWMENTAFLAEGLRCWKLNTRGLLLLDWQRFWRMKVPSFSMLISTRCVKWHNITLPKNKIFLNHPMINGNMLCKVRCVLDRIHTLERSKERRNAMVYRHNSSDSFWRSLLLLLLNHFLSLCHAFLCRPTRAVKNVPAFFMVGLHIGTNSPAVSLNYLLDVAMMNSRIRWNEKGVPIQSYPQQHSLKFLLEIIQKAFKNINGISCL